MSNERHRSHSTITRQERLAILFEGIKEGRPADESYAAVSAERNRRQKARKKDKRGFISEKRVCDALNKLPYVLGVYQTERMGHADRNGIDMIVALSFDHGWLMKSVRVQVKSSQTKIQEFKEDLLRHHNKKEGDMGSLLGDLRLVILNGQRSSDEICESFFNQIESINNYQHSVKTIN